MGKIIKQHYKWILCVLGILLVFGVWQYKKANEVDLTKLRDLEEICELLNLPMDVVYPEGAQAHYFSKKIDLGRGVYTVTFRPYTFARADYDAWRAGLEEASLQVCIGGRMVNHHAGGGQLVSYAGSRHRCKN